MQDIRKIYCYVFDSKTLVQNIQIWLKFIHYTNVNIQSITLLTRWCSEHRNIQIWLQIIRKVNVLIHNLDSIFIKNIHLINLKISGGLRQALIVERHHSDCWAHEVHEVCYCFLFCIHLLYCGWRSKQTNLFPWKYPTPRKQKAVINTALTVYFSLRGAE